MADFDFTIRGGHWTVQAWATSDPVKPSLGYGGHPIGSRPKRKALTVYEGRQPFQLEVPMLLYRGGASVEGDREALDNMATAEGKHLEHGAPGVKIEAEFPLPIPPILKRDSKLEWWIENLDWGDELRNRPEHHSEPGHLIRKNVTVTLLEKVAEEFLGENQGSGGRSRRHQVKRVKGRPETLHEIAAHELHDSKRWKAIAELNHIRSDGHLTVGKWLNLPDTPHHPQPKHPKKTREPTPRTGTVTVK